MEFDTKVSLRPLLSFEADATEDPGAFHKRLWEAISKGSKAVGEGSATELWADYSTFLYSRYVVYRIEDEGGSRRVTALGARKLNLMGDVLLGMLFLLIFRCLSKCIAPSVSAVYPVGMILAVAAAAMLLILSRKPFGMNEAEAVKNYMTKR